MKRFTTAVLMLCIAMMCTAPFEVQGQNRRTGGGSNTTSKTKSSETTLQSRPAQQQQKATQQKPAQQQQKAAQVQDRRTTTTTPSGSSSHSAQISRKNSEVGRQNIPKQTTPKQTAPKAGSSSRNSSAPYYNSARNRKPAAVQYHNQPPRPREAQYARPYLQQHAAPTPSHRYGDHYFGYRLNSLPRGYTTLRVGGLDYYYCDGIYYRPYRLGGYYVVRPPRGTAIASTLFNVALTAITINTIRDEIARARRAAELSTVYGNTRTGYVVRTSDDYYSTNLANQLDQEYYYQDGVFYVLQNGQYFVIEAPIGALVTQIPADYDELELDGRTYYLVENTLYKTTVIDGALYFEVVSNL